MKEEDPPRVRSRQRLWLFAAAMGVVILLLLPHGVPVGSWLRSPYDGKDPVPFDRQAWIDAADDWDGLRYLMVDDLLKNHSPIGLTREELEDFLGPLNPPEKYPGWFCYYLGPEPSPVGVDNIWLAPEFEGDRVVAMTLGTD